MKILDWIRIAKSSICSTLAGKQAILKRELCKRADKRATQQCGWFNARVGCFKNDGIFKVHKYSDYETFFQYLLINVCITIISQNKLA